MQKKKYTGFIIGGILLLLIIISITSYNSLVKKDEKVKQQWAEVQNTYQRRLDLIPNLVNVVKGISNFEQTTLEEIAAARSRAIAASGDNSVSAENINRQRALQDSLASAANRLIILIEKYPELRGTEAYLGLQTQLEGTERRIKVARNDFNAAVADYNNQVRSFPANLVSGLFGYRAKEGFIADQGSDKSVEIKF